MRSVRRGILGSVTAAIALGGCFGKRGELALMTAPVDAVGRLSASPDNAILAIGGTVQLSINVQSLTGVPLTTLDSVVYRLASANDSVRVRVSPAGLATGVASTSGSIPVNVLAFRNGTWNSDQVLVTVTPTAVAGLTLSIQPPLGDSAKLARGLIKTITPVLRNPATGQSVTGIQLQYAVQPEEEAHVGVFTGTIPISSSVQSAVSVHIALSPAAARNQIVPYVAEGTAWIHANVNAYGTMLQDSVLYTWSYPYTGTIRVLKSNLAVQTSINAGTATAAAVNPDLVLAPGATVTFTNGVAVGDPLSLVFIFDNPAAAIAGIPPASLGGVSGNITTLTGGQSSTRKFLVPGAYHWTWAVSGGPAPWPGQTATGVIIIR